MDVSCLRSVSSKGQINNRGPIRNPSNFISEPIHHQDLEVEQITFVTDSRSVNTGPEEKPEVLSTTRG